MNERQELYCHECGNYVQFDLDLSIDGNMVLHCPVCNHEHCRVVKDGKITDERWDSRNSNNNVITTFVISGNITWTPNSTYTTYFSVSTTNDSNSSTTYTGSNFLYGSWMNAIG
jgi:uncharacterized protein YbaR (Trm112 family)